jgi:hypothetical protein
MLVIMVAQTVSKPVVDQDSHNPTPLLSTATNLSAETKPLPQKGTGTASALSQGDNEALGVKNCIAQRL